MEDLNDKIAVVTGASSGIGKATTIALLEAGMKVVGLARRKEKVDELAKNYKGRLFSFKVDLTEEEEILEAFCWIEANFGSIFVFVNNAGISYYEAIEKSETASWTKIIDTNLLALGICTREVIKNMKTYDVNGFIVNINSISGHYMMNVPGLCMYQASKYGVTAFTESIRMELATQESKIRISDVSPGLVETPLSARYSDEFPSIKPENVANAIIYIISQPESVHVSEMIIRPTGERV